MAETTAPTIDYKTPGHVPTDEGVGRRHARLEQGRADRRPGLHPPQLVRAAGARAVMGGSAIGGGEWLTGPAVTARYGGAMLWLATLSILGQVVYNLEISRYTLYTGEPIFTGKFRTLPGPRFWLIDLPVLDFGAVFPYLAANAATPLAAVMPGPHARRGRTRARSCSGLGRSPSSCWRWCR